MIQVDTSSLAGGGENIPERHARGGSHLFQPVPVVQHGGAGAQEGWVSPLLCRFLQVECTHKKDSYPLPRIQEVLESMVGASHFFMMDFKSGFWQVHMAPGSQQYTVFTMGNLGFYEFTRMHFGLCNAPATFQHLMQNTFGELNLTYCVIYLDDVIVFSQMEEEHLKRLHIVPGI